MSTVISVEHVTKAYRLGMTGGATLKEALEKIIPGTTFAGCAPRDIGIIIGT